MRPRASGCSHRGKGPVSSSSRQVQAAAARLRLSTRDLPPPAVREQRGGEHLEHRVREINRRSGALAFPRAPLGFGTRTVPAVRWSGRLPSSWHNSLGARPANSAQAGAGRSARRGRRTIPGERPAGRSPLRDGAAPRTCFGRSDAMRPRRPGVPPLGVPSVREWTDRRNIRVRSLQDSFHR